MYITMCRTEKLQLKKRHMITGRSQHFLLIDQAFILLDHEPDQKF